MKSTFNDKKMGVATKNAVSGWAGRGVATSLFAVAWFTVLLVSSSSLMAGPGTVACSASEEFYADGTAGSAFAVVSWDDGSGPALFVGGQFLGAGTQSATYVSKWDGSRWHALGHGLDGVVRDLIVWDDGNGEALYATGLFFSSLGQDLSGVARWDGNAWSPLVGPSGDRPSTGGWDFEVFDDGTGPALYLTGSFGIDGLGFHLAKWDGLEWSGVATPFNSGVARELAVWDDGNGQALYMVGSFQSATHRRIARWDGTTWTGLGGGLNSLAYTVVASTGPNSALYVGGFFTAADGVPARGVARWDGTAWSALNNAQGQGVVATIETLQVWDDGTGEALYLGGQIASAGGFVTHGAVRFANDTWTALADGFGGVEDRIYDMVAWDDGTGERLAMVGTFGSIGDAVQAGGVATWDGSAWAPLASTPRGMGVQVQQDIRAMVEWDDGNGPALFAGGSFRWAGGVLVERIGRWDGSGWTALTGPLGTGVDGEVYALAVWDDGNGEALYVGGEFQTAGGVASPYLAKWDGSDWSQITSGFDLDGRVEAFAIWDDGDGEALYVGGDFADIGLLEMNHVARWNGTVWSRLGSLADPGVNDTVHALAVWNDGFGESLYVGGFFSEAGGDLTRSLAVWDGSSWDPPGGVSIFPLFDPVYALQVWDDGMGESLYVGGAFDTSSIPGVPHMKNVGRWDGSNWLPLRGSEDTDPLKLIASLAVWDDGRGPALYVGGSFIRIGGITARGLGRWDGEEWSNIRPTGVGGVLPDSEFQNFDTFNVYSMLTSTTPGLEGLFASGMLHMAEGKPSMGISRWQCESVPAQIFADGFESGNTSAWTNTTP